MSRPNDQSIVSFSERFMTSGSYGSSISIQDSEVGAPIFSSSAAVTVQNSVYGPIYIQGNVLPKDLTLTAGTTKKFGLTGLVVESGNLILAKGNSTVANVSYNTHLPLTVTFDGEQLDYTETIDVQFFVEYAIVQRSDGYVYVYKCATGNSMTQFECERYSNFEVESKSHPVIEDFKVSGNLISIWVTDTSSTFSMIIENNFTYRQDFEVEDSISEILPVPEMDTIFIAVSNGKTVKVLRTPHAATPETWQ